MVDQIKYELETRLKHRLATISSYELGQVVFDFVTGYKYFKNKSDLSG